jgi:hypothetical protein
VAIVRRLTAAVLALVLVASAAVLLATPAQAADNGDWAAFPVRAEGEQFTPRQYFFFDVAPGATVRDAVTVRNSTRAPLRLAVYGADAFNVEDGGGFALRKIDDEQVDVGAWISINTDQIVVPAGKFKRVEGKRTFVPGELTVPFTMTVPDNASPGDHTGGFVTLEPEPTTTTDQAGVALGVKRALGVRMYVRVNGPLNPQVIVTDVKYEKLEPATMPFLGARGGARIEYTYLNNGNQRITPLTTITYSGLFGRNLHTIGPVAKPEILPGQSITLVDEVVGMPVLDQVTAKVSIQADARTDETLQDVSAAGTATGFVVSWVFVGVVVLIIAGLVFWRWYRSREVEVVVTTPAAPSYEPTP